MPLVLALSCDAELVIMIATVPVIMHCPSTSLFKDDAEKRMRPDASLFHRALQHCQRRGG